VTVTVALAKKRERALASRKRVNFYTVLDENKLYISAKLEESRDG